MSISWRHDFGARNRYPSRYGMAAILGPRERRALGLHFDPYVGGEIQVELQVAKDRNGGFEIQGRADLAKARLTVGELSWIKPVGQAGRADFSLRVKAGTPLDIKAFQLTTKGFEARGNGRHGDAGSRIVFENIRFANNDFAADLALQADGPVQVALKGAVLDLRPVLESGAMAGASGSSQNRSLSLSANLDRIIVSDSFWLENASATMRRGPARLIDVVARGNLNGGTAIAIRMSPDGKRHQKLVITSEDAGGALVSSGFVTGAKGGRLRLEARIPDAPGSTEPIVGRLQADDFKLIDAPLMTRVLSLGSITGISDLLQGEGITFARLQAPFTMSETAIELGEARAVGPALGVTVSGTIDRVREVLRLRGTVIPAYTINSALGYIPLFGQLFVGRKGEGVFGVSYWVEGTAT